MARTPTQRPEPRRPTPAPTPPPPGSPPKAKESYRETVEAVAVAFILALLVRGFEAEAFVIPTGSMAPTLMGRHKEVTCPQCHYVYPVNASDEVEGDPSLPPRLRRVQTGICANCRYQAKIGDEPSFKGDRILVMKFPYDMPFLPASSGPQRWDVIVFHYPEEPETSYIKRLVGMPGETLRVWYGDIFIRPPGGKDFRQEHRPLEHQQAMQMLVYDDAYRPALLKNRPEWRRWVGDSGGWAEESGTYRLGGPSSDWAELRYRQVVPDPGQWRALESGDPLPRPARPTLITDFYSYNTNLNAANSDLSGPVSRDQEYAWFQPHWVGDLTWSGRVDSADGQGAFRVELVEGGVVNRCEIDLKTGEAVVTHGSEELGRKPTAFRGAGSHGVAFANVDNRLTLWVDGRPVFGPGLTYEDGPGGHPQPTDDDLTPVRLSARGGKVALSGLVLKRDIYYTQNPGSTDYASSWDARLPRTPAELTDWLADPKRVAAVGTLGWTDYPIGDDRYLMLGDNSPRSKDSRGWRNDDADWDTVNRQRWEVPRTMLTGKAFCVYWPHGKPFGPSLTGQGDFRFPFRPYFERMSLIH